MVAQGKRHGASLIGADDVPAGWGHQLHAGTEFLEQRIGHSGEEFHTVGLKVFDKFSRINHALFLRTKSTMDIGILLTG
jgi:hypothetical protein